MVQLNAHCSVLWGNLRINKVSVGFLQRLDLVNKNKTLVQLYRFGNNVLSRFGKTADEICPLTNAMTKSGTGIF